MSEANVKKKGLNPLVLIIIVLVLVIVGLGSYFLFIKKSSSGPYIPAPIVEAKWPTEEFLVNLADTDVDRYLKVKMVLSYDSADSELAAKLEEDKESVRDAIIRVLSERHSKEIRTNEGKDKMNVDIEKKVNAILGGEKIIGVEYTDFLIQ